MSSILIDCIKIFWHKIATRLLKCCSKSYENFFFLIQERRKLAIKEIISLLRLGGRALLYVWAKEQERNKTKSKYLQGKKKHTNSDMDDAGTSSLNTEDVSPEDQMGSCSGASSSQISSGGNNENCSAPVVPDENPTETAGDNSNSEVKLHVNRTNFEAQDLLVPWHLRGENSKEKSLSDDTQKTKTAPVFHRYYHVFHEGEIEKLCQEVEGIKIVHSYYDQGNWCVILEKV